MLNKVKSRMNKKVGKHIIRQEIRRFSTEKKTLDIGCGNSPSADIFPNRVGIDIAPGEGVDVIGDAHELPFDSGSFEQILCSEVLEHLAKPEQAVKEMARVLGDGGRLVLTVPFIYPIHEAPYDYQRFTLYGLRRLFEHFFDIEEIKELYTEEQTLAILLQRIAYQRSDSQLKHYIYLLLSQLIFQFSSNTDTPRFQNIGRSVPGSFMTAGYLLVARKR